MAIYVVTHGEKEPGANPKTTEKGWKEVASLRSHLPSAIPLVIRGEAQRHRDTRDALDLKRHPRQQVSCLWGGAGSLEKRPSGAVLVLADGEEAPFDPTTVPALYPSIKEAVRTLPEDTVVCAGKEAIGGALRKVGGAKGGALYRLHLDEEDQLVVTLVAEGAAE